MYRHRFGEPDANAIYKHINGKSGICVFDVPPGCIRFVHEERHGCQRSRNVVACTTGIDIYADYFKDAYTTAMRSFNEARFLNLYLYWY